MVEKYANSLYPDDMFARIPLASYYCNYSLQSVVRHVDF